ncbi:MAG: cob(I)yrinic acid a,c-diamide adenosyltransferase [Prolixibacteraceae bacterium]|nr:cob(I)yrinic acid a,c-diamide adenosyltransferase [Prolixibacteraceae bacterium]
MGDQFKIYTKTGDDGTTGLFGGSRIKKDDIRLEAYGTLDELNSYIGLIRSFDLEDYVIQLLIMIQENMFSLSAILASDNKGKQITVDMGCSEEDTLKLEKAIDLFEKDLPELKNFILPGGNQLAAHCHIARTVCRRAERRIIQIKEAIDLPDNSLKFINRLSDFLFVLARKITHDNNEKETFWISK